MEHLETGSFSFQLVNGEILIKHIDLPFVEFLEKAVTEKIEGDKPNCGFCKHYRVFDNDRGHCVIRDRFPVIREHYCDKFENHLPMSSPDSLNEITKPLKCKDCYHCDLENKQLQVFPNDSSEPLEIAPCKAKKHFVNIECHSDPCNEFMKTEPELKPCPFCGNNDLFANFKNSGYQVHCKKCHCETSIFFDKETAIQKWNNRV
ncbi:restriction alleviation protein, Lar family [candidate division KSB1 bacterium]|nr:restriction alleviation protein, Lar family [candidate division KSB1 bacterium]